VVLGVAASDAHAVANQLIAHGLRAHGFTVVNLGVCTPVAEFADAVAAHPATIAVVIGSLNGHAHEDLRDLRAAKADGRIPCPVVVGGNLSVGGDRDATAARRLRELGVDHVLTDTAELLALLTRLAAGKAVPTLLDPVS
jgi:methylaspartate mutase sigma subunit